MIKKVLALMLVLSSVFLCGCDNSKRIDKAVIIECIIVDKSDYKFIYISDKENKLIAAKGKLDGLNPLNVLNRGYAIAEKDEKIITSSKQLKDGDDFTVILSDGKINAKVCGE